MIAATSHASLTLLVLLASAMHAVAGDWEASGEQTRPIPLPYQAARMRIVVRYSGEQPSEPTSRFSGDRLKEIRFPKSPDFRGVQGGVFSPNARKDGNAYYNNNYKTPQVMHSGDEQSLSVSFAGELVSERKVIFFTRPGTYQVKVGGFEPRLDMDVQIVSEPIAIVVLEPEGDDQAVYEKLQKSPELAQAMLHPNPSRQPDPKLVVPLKELIKQYPKSSYAEYARFALARSHAKGQTEADQVAAIELLEDIDHKSFAYGDYSLALWRRILEALFSRDEAKVAAELDRLFPDSLIRLKDLAQRVTLEEWKKLNPRAPVNRKTEKPEAPPTDDSTKK